MTFHSGLDMSAYPGLDTLAWIKSETGISFVGFYLGPAPSHPDDDWMQHRDDLMQQGWGLAPIYVGQELAGPGSHAVTAQQGDEDGRTAAVLMERAGFPRHSTCYLDLEDGAPLEEPRASYVKYWAGSLFGGGYMPGVYCSHAIADAVASMFAAESVESPRIWAFKVPTTATHPIGDLSLPAPDPSGCGFANATAWQRDQNAEIHTPHGTVLVDVSTSTLADPSAP